MDREHIIRELQRTAADNGGIALGQKRFKTETGIRLHEWYGKFWTKWSDAIREAGLEPNEKNVAYTDDYLLQKLILLTKSLGRVPTQGDVLMAARGDDAFPSEKAFRRLGNKNDRARRVIDLCKRRDDHEDVVTLWESAVASPAKSKREMPTDNSVVGFVYLVRHGNRNEYKIGRTMNLLRREGQIAIQLPEVLEPVHYIKTDDPGGVEAYWHNRFAKKRKEGEWFALSATDVSAFKRWKRIY